ncbi:MAG: DUF2779 domain-containing protein [Pseudomonadota bacterium]
MRALSKSKLMAYRQCPKRLWLEIHRPALRDDSDATHAGFAVGHSVGDIARRIYDPKSKGTLIEPFADGIDAACERTTQLLASSHPIFEAGYSAAGALAFSDVLLPKRKAGQRVWRMVEVKSSTSVKPYHRDDAAIQAFVAKMSGVALESVALAHIDSSWTYPGQEDYSGLLKEEDLSAEVFARTADVAAWIAGAHAVARKKIEPAMATGQHCNDPYGCGFIDHCRSAEPQATYPVAWLPRVQTSALKTFIAEGGVTELAEVPDTLLNATQLRVKSHTIAGTTYFDAGGAAADLQEHKLPAIFLDFETISFAVPIWAGTRPYQQIPFQFSAHRLGRTGKIAHHAFLDLSGRDPSRAFAEALIGACGERGPIFVYNAGFENARIRELAERFPRVRRALLAITARVVDLLPVAQRNYYHPEQQGSWSIKKVLPSIAPDLSYAALGGIQHGGMAMEAFMEAISPQTSAARKEAIERELLDYCALDTMAMVRLWAFFSGRNFH